MSENCIFCRIASGEIPSTTLYEDESFKVILDAFPSSLGHALVIPKKHVADIFELDEQNGEKIFGLAARYAKKLKNALDCDGLNVLQNNGEKAGQTVFHFHIHIIPRYDGDDVTIRWRTVKPKIADVENFMKKLQ